MKNIPLYRCNKNGCNRTMVIQKNHSVMGKTDKSLNGTADRETDYIQTLQHNGF